MRVGDGHGGQNATRGTAKNELTQSRMPVSAHYDEIRRHICRVGQDSVWNIQIGGYDALDFDFQAMAGEMVCDVSAGNFVTLDIGPDGHHFDCPCACKKWVGIGDGAGSVTATIPADQDMIEPN